MQRFTIRDIEHLCGIKAHTLRIWEQRYSLFKAKRKESKQRFYDNEDLKKLLRISFLYHSGWKISGIATLSDEEILKKVRDAEISATTYKHFIAKLLEAAVDFDEPSFQTILDELIRNAGLEKCVREICYPFLQRVGLLWTSNNIIPAQEHFSSYIIQHKIIAETDKLPPVPLGAESIILFTPIGEQHELPLLFINYLLRKNGWHSVYLGCAVTLQTLQEVTGHTSAKYLYLHLITNLTGIEINDYLEKLCRCFLHLKVIASGSGIQKAQRSFVNFVPLKTDEAIYSFIGRKTIPSAEHSFSRPHG